MVRLAAVAVVLDAAAGVPAAAATSAAAAWTALGRAFDAAEAQRFLMLLSGRRHHVYTGVVLLTPEGRQFRRLVDTIVTFQRLTEAQVADYLAGDEWQGKAGGYAIQGRAEAFVRFLSGSHSGVVGLPLFETRALLAAAGLPPVAAALG